MPLNSKMFLNGPLISLFLPFLNNLLFTHQKNLADVGIWSADLWHLEQTLCQLRHNHGPKSQDHSVDIARLLRWHYNTTVLTYQDYRADIPR